MQKIKECDKDCEDQTKLMMKTYIWESLIQMLAYVCMNMIKPIKEESIPIVLPSYYAFIDVRQYLVSFNL